MKWAVLCAMNATIWGALAIFAFSPTVSTNLTVWIAAGVVCLAVDDAARRRERGE